MLIRELWRNAELRELCGFDMFCGSRAAPSDDAFGRFLALVVDNRDLVAEMFHTLVDEIKNELPDLG